MSRPSALSAPSRVVARPLSSVYAVLFLVVTSVPPVIHAWIGADEGVERELRRTTAPPRLEATARSLTSFPQAFSRWYASHFVFRSALLRRHNYVKFYGLATSPSEKLIVGDDDWIYYVDNEALEQARGTLPFEPFQLASWVTFLEERHEFLARLGVPYVFAIAPSKATIYPDGLPPGYRPVGPSRMDELVAALEESPVRFVDLRAALEDERREDRPGDPVYYPFGTHWTARGGLRACRELWAALDECVPDLPPLPGIDAFERSIDPESEGDCWADRLYLEPWMHQVAWNVRAADARASERIPFAPRQSLRFVPADGPGGGRRGVFYHDSFGKAVRPYLARACDTLDSYWTSEWDVALLEAEPPAFVVEVLTDRKLATTDPRVFALQTQDRLKARFEASQDVLWEAARPDPSKPRNLGTDSNLFGQLPEITVHGEEECVLAVDAGHADDGVLELYLVAPRGQKLKPLVTRSFARAGRGVVYLDVRSPKGREPWLAARGDGWTIHGVEARRVATR